MHAKPTETESCMWRVYHAPSKLGLSSHCATRSRPVRLRCTYSRPQHSQQALSPSTTVCMAHAVNLTMKHYLQPNSKPSQAGRLAQAEHLPLLCPSGTPPASCLPCRYLSPPLDISQRYCTRYNILDLASSQLGLMLDNLGLGSRSGSGKGSGLGV